MDKYRRTNYFIKKGFQVRYMVIVYIIVAAVIIGITLALYFFGRQDLWTSPELYEKLQQTKTVNDLIFSTVLNVAIGALVASLIFVVVRFLFVSHRVAGPIYRFELSLREIRKGNMSFRIYLRNRDDKEMKYMAEEFNRTLDYLDNKFSTISNQVDLLEETISAARSGDDTNLIPELQTDIEKLKNLLDFLKLRNINF